ncbi:hypothetical protein SAMN04487967_0693 [Natronorubrum sediminis]|uniref:Alpha/beta hydrolase domain-containing protein n=1 Tax=Natronorubrum sediminis TaxID=640943 RepID=A0A1H6FR12_9EURY|nr:alpha/beta hydrolase domain-containing protein [Natronorubrum sediminis]SEH12184.1 hypothetical protein SAMN04487967_0693 [Natronorubrum sediminis]
MSHDTNRRDPSAPSEEPETSDRRGLEQTVARRSVLAGVSGLVAGSAMVGSASASDHGNDVALPEMEGPIDGGSQTGNPQTAAVHDVESYGYTEEEYFFSGTARSDTYFGTFGGLADEDEYQTRAIVYRPEDEADFNGHLLADWSNVSTGIDMPVTWINAYEYLMREGYAVAVVSAQAVGVDTSSPIGDLGSGEGENLVAWDPERYGDLEHPGDDYALDIFSQVVEGLRTGGADDSSLGSTGSSDDSDPLAGLDVEYVLATGQSQSAGYMASLITDVQEEYGNIDGYLPAASAVTDYRDDLVPVLWLNTEDEAEGLFGDIGGGDPPDDSGQFRLWEVAGASHVNYWLSSWNAAMIARDFGGEDAEWDETAAGDFGTLEDGEYGDCGGNYFPARYAYSAALEALRTWVEDDTEPDDAPRIEREDGSVVTDEHGNVHGGVRLPSIEVPVAEYDARSCDLEGQTMPFDDDTLEELYESNDEYVAQFEDAVDDAVESGYLLGKDADDLLERAQDAELIDDSDGYWWQ